MKNYLNYNAKLKLAEVVTPTGIYYTNTTNLKRWLKKNNYDIKKVGDLILLFTQNSVPTTLYTKVQ